MKGKGQVTHSLHRDETGRTLVIALVALALGLVLVTGFMYYVSTSQVTTRATGEQTVDHYSTDAGVEYAIWKLTHSGYPTTTLESGLPVTDTITINGQTVLITVTKVLTP